MAERELMLSELKEKKPHGTFLDDICWYPFEYIGMYTKSKKNVLTAVGEKFACSPRGGPRAETIGIITSIDGVGDLEIHVSAEIFQGHRLLYFRIDEETGCISAVCGRNDNKKRIVFKGVQFVILF